MKQRFELYPTEHALDEAVSPKMIKTLKKCYQLETAYPGKPYGPKDIKESFNGLYKRGLLDIDLSNKKLKTGRWYITKKGLHFLVHVSTKRLSVNDPLLFDNINKLKDNLAELQNSMNILKVTSGNK